MYQIKYEYKTGSSFGSHDETDILEYEWEDINVAAEALKRIYEHYKWYQYMESPRWTDEVPKPEWYNIKHGTISEDLYHNLINIPMDDGQEVQFSPPWCGYFEKLYAAEIVIAGKGMRFEL